SAEAIKKGIASDGGLFVPEAKVKLGIEEISKLTSMNYRERAVFILKQYLDDYSLEELNDCVNSAYTSSKFGSEVITPIVKINENVHILELWHGPTCAFKDMALQILPHFLVKAMKKTNEKSEIVILVATSGDTGKAALEGFKDVAGTKIIVFFPDGGVSEVQRMQMVTQEGSNVHSIAVRGNFDDAQTGVKNIFSDKELNVKMEEKSFKFSSANSINWGRLVPQIVYYFSAYADLIKSGEIIPGDKINFIVPTGNFGNILAAYYASEMGLPINRLICASNENNVLTDFIKTGTYDRNREFKKTISPSMDILISSNLERLLFELTGHDSSAVKKWMEELKTRGSYSVDANTRKSVQKLFWSDFSSEVDTTKTIECIYREYGYVVDTHTAVAIDVYDKYVISTGDMTKSVIVSTASPFKFNESVVKAIFGNETAASMDEFKLLGYLSSKTGLKIPEGLTGLDKKPILHKVLCEKSAMKDEVGKILGI
ncbi:MAG TPA: threonine synthase, partial [Clostridia bacterium]